MRSIALPGVAELRPMAVTMAATVASYGSALLLDRITPLRTEIIVLAVVVPVMLGGLARRVDPRVRLLALPAIPVATLVAAGIGTRMYGERALLGSALFVLAISATVWIRRWGARATVLGALVTVPLLATLVAPVPPGARNELWAAVVGLLAFGWVSIAHLVAERTGFTGGHVEPAASVPSSRRTVRPSTRMAVQLGVALAAAFVLGHVLLGAHWPWVVLTAFIVCSGNRGRGDVVLKGLQRVLGASVGTLLATGVALLFAPRDPAQVVAIFVVLALGTWARSASYAYWAACVTAALALLYGYFGQTGTHLLLTRVWGIVLGGALGVLACWFILPIRTTDVVRRRTADALAALTDALKAGPDEAGCRRFDHAVRSLTQVAPPLELHRRLTAAWHDDPHHVEACGELERCISPMWTIGQASADVLAEPEIVRARTEVLGAVVARRRAMTTGAAVRGDLDQRVRDLGDAVGRASARLGPVS